EVLSRDEDNDLLHLRAEGENFLLDDLGMEFSPASGYGPLKSSFTWNPSCNNISNVANNTFTVFFITEDEDHCKHQNIDTLAVTFKVSPPPNASPSLEMAQSLTDLTVIAGLDSTFSYTLIGTDTDGGDLLNLNL